MAFLDNEFNLLQSADEWVETLSLNSRRMEPSNSQVLDEFGQAVMTQVRDEGISYLVRILSGKMADAESNELYAQLKNMSPTEDEAMRRLLVTAVDAGVVRFLHFIDEFQIQLKFHSHSGETVDIRAISDGLAGELHTNNGWIARFSKFADRITP